MAVGARISSTNLSGKTATVTFTPYTGTTSGTTVNLGTQTIPFNNITSHPYGVYSMYFAEYDYTYTLTITPESGENQSFQFTSTVTGTTSLAAANLRFDDLTAEVIDYGIDMSNWYIDDQYFVTEGGYMIVLYGQNDYQDRLVLFTDYRGELIEQYSGNTNNYDYDILEGKITYFAWEDLGVAKYSDGNTVYTFNWTSGTGTGEFDRFDVEWDWDAVTKDNKFVIDLYNTSSQDHEYFLAYQGTHTSLTTSNNNVSYKFFSFINNGEFMVLFERDSSTDIYGDIKIYNTSGNLIRTFELPNPYTSYNHNLFGDNQFGIVLWNYSDADIDYYVIRYNFNTDTFTTTTHVRGTNYQNCNTYSDGGFWPNNTDNSAWVVALYSNTINSSGVSGDTLNYCDFIYTLDNSETIYSDVYQDSGTDDKSIYLWFPVSKRPVTHGNTGDGNVSSIQFTPSGLTYNVIGPISSYYDSWSNRWYFGERVVFDFRDTNDANNAFFYLISSGNTTLDTITFTTIDGPWNFNTDYSYDIFYVTDFTDGWIVNKNLNEFTSIGVYNQQRYDGYLDESDYRRKGFIIYNDNTNKARVLTATSISSEITLPSWNDFWSLRFGRDRFLFVYGDTSDGTLHMNLYDHNGVLKNSLHTSYLGYWTTHSAKDRYVVVINEDSTYICYLVSDSTITSVTISDNNSYDTINDFVWWD